MVEPQNLEPVQPLERADLDGRDSVKAQKYSVQARQVGEGAEPHRLQRVVPQVDGPQQRQVTED